MMEPLETFETFLRLWVAENIGSSGDRSDPREWDAMAKRRADELTKAATNKGFYGELVEAAKPYGGVTGFIRSKFEEASGRR